MTKKNVAKRLGRNGTRKAGGTENSPIQRLMRIDPDAHEVFVAGSFNNWNPCSTPLTNIGRGRWAKELTLAPGRYEYQFVVDGRWMPDRQAEELTFNDFGELNSVLLIPRAPFKVKELHTQRGPFHVNGVRTIEVCWLCAKDCSRSVTNGLRKQGSP